MSLNGVLIIIEREILIVHPIPRCYGTMREKELFRVDGLEWLSTAMWHLQLEIELSALANDLMTTERHHVSTWIAAGNCFSLHKEHETAIKFFERAIQVSHTEFIVRIRIV